jgi:hypothetical protein
MTLSLTFDFRFLGFSPPRSARRQARWSGPTASLSGRLEPASWYWNYYYNYYDPSFFFAGCIIFLSSRSLLPSIFKILIYIYSSPVSANILIFLAAGDAKTFVPYCEKPHFNIQQLQRSVIQLSCREVKFPPQSLRNYAFNFFSSTKKSGTSNNILRLTSLCIQKR